MALGALVALRGGSLVVLVALVVLEGVPSWHWGGGTAGSVVALGALVVLGGVSLVALGTLVALGEGFSGGAERIGGVGRGRFCWWH